MASANLTYTIENGTPADATQVQQNFVDLRDHANTEVVHRDGSLAMTGQLTLPADPTAGSHAVRDSYMKSYIDSYVDGAYVHAKDATGQVTVKDQFKTISSWTEVRDSGGNFSPSTGVFTVPRTGIYSVSLTAKMDGEDPPNNHAAYGLYRYRIAVVAAGAGDTQTPTYAHDVMVVNPMAMSQATGFFINFLGTEHVKVTAQVAVYAEQGQEIRPQVSLGGAYPIVAAGPWASNLTITWLHG